MVARHGESGTYGHGITPWYVPAGAEWDRDPHYAGMKLRTRRRISGAGFDFGEGAWAKWNPFPLCLEDFNLEDSDEVEIHWDEVEDFSETDSDWITPCRPTLRAGFDDFERPHPEPREPFILSIGPKPELPNLTLRQWAQARRRVRLAAYRAAVDAEGLEWLRHQTCRR